MGKLATVYDTVKPNARMPFDANTITDFLMAEPYNIDISNIIHTPGTVIVNLPCNEYHVKGIGNAITHKFRVNITCEAHRLIIKKCNCTGDCNGCEHKR